MLSLRATAVALIVGLLVGTTPIFTAEALSPRQLEAQRKHEKKVQSLYSSSVSSSSSSKAVLRTKTVKKQRASSSRKSLVFKKDCTVKAWSCVNNLNICTNGIYQQTCTLIDGSCLKSEKVKPQPKICSSSSKSSSYSGTIYDDIYLSGFAGKGQLNIDTLEEWIEVYGDSPSHRSVVSDLYDILFELKGLQKQIESLAEKAAESPLNDADNKKAGEITKKINDLINKSNKIVPN